jgi:hypothetical protein
MRQEFPTWRQLTGGRDREPARLIKTMRQLGSPVVIGG